MPVPVYRVGTDPAMRFAAGAAADQKGPTDMGEIDPKLLEMAEVFHIPKSARMKYIVLPAKMPGLSRLLHKTGKTSPRSGRDNENAQAGGPDR